MLVIVTYDIKDDKRRSRIYKTLLNYGIPVQLSVFECNLTPKELNNLEVILKKLILLNVDDIRFYSLCESCRNNTVNQKGLTEKLKKIII